MAEKRKLHPCCDPLSASPIWEGTSRGNIIITDGVEVYISHARNNKEGLSMNPKEGKRVILFLTEAHSIYFLNAQLLADSFALHLDCDVIMPDQFRGERRVPVGKVPHFPEGKAEVPKDSSYPPPYPQPWSDEDFEIWKRAHEPPITDPVLERVVQYIYRAYGQDIKIGGLGYCFGGRYVIRLMGTGIIDVGVVNHPSFFTLEEVGKLGSGKKLAIYAAETDDILTAEKRRGTEDILSKEGAIWMSTVFSGTEHGFSVRGDLNVKEVRLAKERAFRGAVEWFMDWL